MFVRKNGPYRRGKPSRSVKRVKRIDEHRQRRRRPTRLGACTETVDKHPFDHLVITIVVHVSQPSVSDDEMHTSSITITW